MLYDLSINIQHSTFNITEIDGSYFWQILTQFDVYEYIENLDLYSQIDIDLRIQIDSKSEQSFEESTFELPPTQSNKKL